MSLCHAVVKGLINQLYHPVFLSHRPDKGLSAAMNQNSLKMLIMAERKKRGLHLENNSRSILWQSVNLVNTSNTVQRRREKCVQRKQRPETRQRKESSGQLQSFKSLSAESKMKFITFFLYWPVSGSLLSADARWLPVSPPSPGPLWIYLCPAGMHHNLGFLQAAVSGNCLLGRHL